jgi:hypothetical protein
MGRSDCTSNCSSVSTHVVIEHEMDHVFVLLNHELPRLDVKSLGKDFVK